MAAAAALITFIDRPEDDNFQVGRGADHLVGVDARSPLYRARALIPTLFERVPGSGILAMPLVHVVRLVWPVFRPTEQVKQLAFGEHMVLPSRVSTAIDDLAAAGVDFGAAGTLCVLCHQIKNTVDGWSLEDPRTALAPEHLYPTQAAPGGRAVPAADAMWPSNIPFKEFGGDEARLGSLTMVYGVLNPVLAAQRYAAACNMRLALEWRSRTSRTSTAWTAMPRRGGRRSARCSPRWTCHPFCASGRRRC